ncbi:MAG: hypothetical protein H7A25_07275 [Leptospiraceae bacterium]|nr:hypothetical protein [Leptospiraceae bacterium]MCP5499685.1 hypothetical protein [Leptospiraceae bacterium]
MADLRRFEYFAGFIHKKFGTCRIYDVAGGMGKLNEELSKLGCDVLTFDKRHKHLPVKFEVKEFTLEEECRADLVVGMHPDGATKLIIDYAAMHNIPFAIVPCCSDNGMSYKTWIKFLKQHTLDLGMGLEEASLPMKGRATVLIGRPNLS